MSYDISLKEPESDETIVFDQRHDITGGTFAVGGTDEAWLNITYNYGKFYYKYIDPEKGIRFLYGKTGKESIPLLEKAIKKLGTEKNDDYWKATAGNAGIALQGLLVFAKMRPDGIFGGD